MDHLKTYTVNNYNGAPSIVLLHGYGANGRDLIGITQHPALENLEINWFFLEAPLSPPELAVFGGKAWFNLLVSEFTKGMQSPKGMSEFYETTPPEFQKSLEQIKNTIWNLNLGPNTFIGGFSQGAMMATNCFFESPQDYKGLLALSGTPLGYKNWSSLEEAKPVFLTHGMQDPIIPFQCGKDFEEKLKNHNMNTETHWFQGGHEIPYEVINKLAGFLKIACAPSCF